MFFSNVRLVPLVTAVLAIIVGLSGCTRHYDPYYPRTHRAVYGGQLASGYPCGPPPPVSCRSSYNNCCPCCGPELYGQTQSARYDDRYSIQPYPSQNYRQPYPANQPYSYQDYRRPYSANRSYGRRGGSVSVYGPYGAETRGAYYGPYGSMRTSRSARYY